MNNVNYVKSVPVAYKTDVCIVGGGIAGIAAAMAAAASGTNVLLIERFGVLGGNATTGGVANFCGNCAGQGEAFDTIIRTLELFNAISGKNKGKHGLGGRVFNHEILAVILIFRRYRHLCHHGKICLSILLLRQADDRIIRSQYQNYCKNLQRCFGY